MTHYLSSQGSAAAVL